MHGTGFGLSFTNSEVQKSCEHDGGHSVIEFISMILYDNYDL